MADAGSGGLQSSARLRISNLPPNTTQLHLYQLCARFGAILSCALSKEEDASCAAVLVFKRAEEAAQVELKLDGSSLQGRKLQVQLC
jgi:RNA recognition motif-containing protein